MTRKSYRTFAAIHLGTEALGMAIVEYRNLKNFKVLEQVRHKIHLGEETFANKTIPFARVSEICEVLQGFVELMRCYGVEDYRAFATTAVREARNQPFLLDQIRIKTGLSVEVIGVTEEIFTKYVAIMEGLRDCNITGQQDGVMLMDISSGALGLTCVQGGAFCYQQNLHIGTIRIKEWFNRNQRSGTHFSKALREYLASVLNPVGTALADVPVRYLVLGGAETAIVLRLLNREISSTGLGQSYEFVETKEFLSVYKKLERMTSAQMASTYKLTQTESDLVLPTVHLYRQLLEVVPVEKLILSPDRFMEGMVQLYIGSRTDENFRERLEREKLLLAHYVGRQYHYEREHVEQVERLACVVFDKICKSQGLTRQDRLLLRAAAILHDIGKYVNIRLHAHYSHELIMGTDLPGFSASDKRVIALIACLHSGDSFDLTPTMTGGLPPQELARTAKLGAILRLADAMDRSYRQKIGKCKASLKGRELLVQVQSRQDLDLEEWIFDSKAAMFEEVFGLKVRMERVKSND